MMVLFVKSHKSPGGGPSVYAPGCVTGFPGTASAVPGDLSLPGVCWHCSSCCPTPSLTKPVSLASGTVTQNGVTAKMGECLKLIFLIVEARQLSFPLDP